MYAHLDAELEKLENDIRHTGARYELAEHKMSTIGSPNCTLCEHFDLNSPGHLSSESH